MRTPKFSTRSISITALALSFLTLISSNIYFAASEPGSITGCVNKKTGALRIVAKCTSAERSIQWGKIGPAGAVGEIGLPGEPGPAGAMGPAGAVGPAGAQGLPGVNGINGFSGSNGAPGANGANGRQLVVRDAANTLVGYLIGTLSLGNTSTNPPAGNYFQSGVQVWDPNLELMFVYSFSGRPMTGYMLFSQPSCTGQAYLADSSSQVGDVSESGRYLAHSSSPTGPIQWFEKAASTYQAGAISIASAPQYANNCLAGSEFGDANFSGEIPHIVLNPIPSPVPSFTGPLRITLS